MSKSKYLFALLIVVVPLFAAGEDDLPSPFRRVDNWAKLPGGMKLGQAISVDGDAAGHVWVFHRGEPPVLEFDNNGNLLKFFGKDMFVQSHGLCLDPDGSSIWLSDGRAKDGKGQQVFKVNQDGKILMTLGKAGVSGATEDTFNAPSDIAIAPGTGDIFVADGHGGQTNARIVKFSKDGKFIKTWGKLGSAPGDFNIPHSLAFDSQGRLFVADRGNNRIQIFDQDGKFLAEWKQFGRPSGIFIAKDDTIYVVDSESNKARNPGFKRGIRIGNAKDGTIREYIPDVDPNPDTTTILGAEGVGVDRFGDVYAAQVGRETVTKFIRIGN
jgi:DNA-binding beta-propeller fold protein YncE